MWTEAMATAWLVTTVTHLGAGLGGSHAGLTSLAARNALCTATGAVFVGTVFVIMWSASAMLQSVNIPVLRHLLTNSWFFVPLATTAFAAGFVGSMAWRLNAGLPGCIVFKASDLLLLFVMAMAGVWVVGAATEGLDHPNRLGAWTLLWFTLIAVVLFNATYAGRTSGLTEPGNVPWRNRVHALREPGWLAVVIVWAAAVRVVWMRIGEHGLSVNRVWATLVCAVLGIVVLGYLLPRRRGQGSDRMPRIGQVNVFALIVGSLGIMVLLSPVANIRDLVVNDQMARLLGGTVKPDKFDYPALRFQLGRQGRAALDMLADGRAGRSASPSVDREQIRQRARLALAIGRYPPDEPIAPASGEAAVTLLSRSDEQGRAFVAWLKRSGSANGCFQYRLPCAVWAEDMDGDDQPDMALVMKNVTEIYRSVPSHSTSGDAAHDWELIGVSRSSNVEVSDWIDCHRNGRISAEMARLKRLKVGPEVVDFIDPAARKAWPNGKTLAENCQTAVAP